MSMSQSQGPIVNIAHLGPPTGGWNSRENWTNMDSTDAVRLDNLVPDTTWVRLRRGSQLYSTIPGAITPVRSLMVYAGANGLEQLLVGCGGKIWNVASTAHETVWDGFTWDGANWDAVAAAGTPTSIASGFTSDVWQYTNFSFGGTHYIVAVNGTGLHWTYDGTTWATTTNTWGPTGTPPPTTSTFSSVCAYQQRLFFTCDDNLYLYYLPLGQFQGEIHGINVGQFMPRGGQMACLGTWTRDDGFGGMNNVLVVVSTMGEAVIFSGTDPDNASSWTLEGRFEIGRPVSGHRQLTWIGPDMLIICEDGFQPLSGYLSTGESKALSTNIAAKIGNAVTQAVKLGGGLFGWEAILYPANNLLWVNIPQTGGNCPQQYVVNTITGAWCRFLGLKAWTWCRFNGALYFGSDNGAIVQADIGPSDQGNPISFEMVTSFQMLGTYHTQMMAQAIRQKRVTMCRPYIMADGLVIPALDVSVDYNIMPATDQAVIDGPATTEWDNFDWDEAAWSSGPFMQSNWYSVSGVGIAFAVHMSGSGMANTMQIFSLDVTFETGLGIV